MRDPRCNPKPGDVVKRGVVSRMIVNVTGDSVWYRIKSAAKFEVLSCLLGEWRIETKNSEVLHVAD